MKMKTLSELVPFVCSECGGRALIWDPDSGEEVCGGCGLVISELILYTGPEWRAFTKSENETRPRVGLPPSFSIHDKGLSTMIGPVYKDAYGRRIPQETRLRMLRLRKWHIRSRCQSSVDRNLSQAMTELSGLSDRLHTPAPVKGRAAVIYRKALDQGLVEGRSISAIAAASLYAACRMTQTPRTLREITGMGTIDRKEIARCYRILLQGLSLRMPVPSAQLRVPRIAAKVDIGENTQRKAIEILGEAERLKITVGKDPMGLAASALYIACVMNGENRTQKTIAEAAGVTEVTIRDRYQELKRVLDLDRFKPERG
jgi:transcription initiation factor TFIIB